VNEARAGVPYELEEALSRGKPGFLIAGFGGAINGYAKDRNEVFSRLRNGLSAARNRTLAASTDVDELVRSIIAQVQLLPLVRENVACGRLFRILALDGGGLRGTFTAAVLAKWDDMIRKGGGNNIVKNFDLLAGTSTGAILAIGLAFGLTPLDMLNFYRSEGPKIFPKDRRLRHWLKSKHESSTLRAALESVFKENKLSQNSCCRLVLPTVRAIHGEAEAIVTAHTPDRTAFRDILAVEAALASSAAPTYFDEAVIEGPIAAAPFLDGGIWANNPVLPAIAEAVRYLKVPLDRIDVLSVGTLANEADFTESLGKGKAGWAPTSADLFFAAQEHAAVTLATSFLSNARHLRVNQQTPSAIKLDDREAIEDMALRGANVGQDSFITVRSRFLDGFHPPDWRSAANL
jgi:patatin-like phospholipase/acyl hydrolase